MRASWALLLGAFFALLLLLSGLLWLALDQADTTIAALAAHTELQRKVTLQQQAFNEVAGWIKLGAVAILLSALGLIAAVIWMISMRILRPLSRVVSSCDAMAFGDLSVPLERFGNDEIGQLWVAIGALQQRLSRTVAMVRLSAQAVHRGARHIAAGNNSFSKRTEQQAARSRKTASRMESLTGSVKQYAEQARIANRVTQQAARTAEGSSASVNAVSEHIQRIQQAAQQMSDMLPALESITAQTSLLARNAMVEAAVAGEQGKSFALIASEVKALATRSADATDEVRSLVRETLQASNASTDHVRHAKQQTAELSSTVQQIKRLVDEAASAWQQQRQGVELLNSAIAQIDQLSQQNASLVQEDAKAADQVEAAADRLTKAVAVFKLAPETAQHFSGSDYNQVASWVSTLTPEDLEQGYRRRV